MKRLELTPEGFPCALKECPPGFFLFGEEVCLKSEYGPAEAFCSSGEAFWGGTKTKDDLYEVMVQPLSVLWRTGEV